MNSRRNSFSFFIIAHYIYINKQINNFIKNSCETVCEKYEKTYAHLHGCMKTMPCTRTCMQLDTNSWKTLTNPNIPIRRMPVRRSQPQQQVRTIIAMAYALKLPFGQDTDSKKPLRSPWEFQWRLQVRENHEIYSRTIWTNQIVR